MQVTRVAPGWPVPSLMHRRRVMADRITYVGLDVHKDSIVVGVAVGGLRGEVREYGRIANTPTGLDRLLRKLGGDGTRLRFCYEAGPCGYGIQRRLSTQGHECVVVAPSLIPKRAGDRVKTDRRGGASLAKLHRAGELTAVKSPEFEILGVTTTFRDTELRGKIVDRFLGEVGRTEIPVMAGKA